jgi:hypothetical protein
MYAPLLNCVWANGSDALLGITDDLIISANLDEVNDLAEAKFITEMICVLGTSWMQHYSNEESSWWDSVLGRVISFSGTLRDLISNLIAEIANRLLDIRERCWPKMEAEAAGLAARAS